MNITSYLENKLVDHVFRNTAYQSPTKVYVALHTANPTESGATGESTYARKEVTFGAPVAGKASNTTDIQWDVTSNVTFSHVTIADALTGGNKLFFGALTESKAMANGEIFRIPAGSLSVEFD